MLEKASLSEYINQANKYLNDEKSRCDRYLTWDIRDNLLKVFRNEMLISEYNSLFERDTGIRYLLNQDKYEDLKLLYVLYSEIPEYLKPISAHLRTHIEQQGHNLLNKVEYQEEGKALRPKDILQQS